MRISTLLLPPFPFPPALPRPRHPQISCGGRSSRCEVRQEGLGYRGSGCWEGGMGFGSQGSRAGQGGSVGGEGTEPPSVSCQLSFQASLAPRVSRLWGAMSIPQGRVWGSRRVSSREPAGLP